MTLKERLQTKVSINTDGEASRLAKECEQIADDFAIGFAEWVVKTNAFLDYGYDEALQIYKKEKGL